MGMWKTHLYRFDLGAELVESLKGKVSLVGVGNNSSSKYKPEGFPRSMK